jgi:hypothetical protein
MACSPRAEAAEASSTRQSGWKKKRNGSDPAGGGRPENLPPTPMLPSRSGQRAIAIYVLQMSEPQPGWSTLSHAVDMARIAEICHAFGRVVGFGSRISNPRFLRDAIIYIFLVSSDLGDETATARQAVLSTEPDDDAGADTADRYEWQAAMAAADGLSLYLDVIEGASRMVGADTGIICEHHEDWVVVRSGEAGLVSAKHREPSVGVFTTIPQLLGDGGLAHLFGRWYATSELPYCRLVTTAGLGRGPAQELSEATPGLLTLSTGDAAPRVW